MNTSEPRLLCVEVVADLLMPGLRFKLWPIYGVQKFPWVQVPAGEPGAASFAPAAPRVIEATPGRQRFVDGVLR